MFQPSSVDDTLSALYQSALHEEYTLAIWIYSGPLPDLEI